LAGVTEIVPGVAVATVLAVISNTIHNLIVIGAQKPVSAVVIAIIIGMIVRSTGGRKHLAPGLSFSVKKILRLAIILLGFDLKLSSVVATGVGTLGVILAAVLAGILSAVYLGRLMGLRDELSTLIGTGTAICGATAIVAAAPAVGADDSDVSYAVGTITIFGILAIFAYPFLGHGLGLTDSQFGTWAGTAVHETAQVLAVGFAYSDPAGKIAAIVKLTRTTLLAPLVVVLGAMYARKRTGKFSREAAMKAFPYFILWFLAASVVRTVVDGFAGAGMPTWTAFLNQAKEASKFLIVVAMAATGMMTDFDRMRKVGIKPFVSGLAASLVVGALSLLLIRLW